jgi:MoxR-like ATPase
MFNLKIDYPSKEEEIKIVQSTTGDTEIDNNPILSRNDLLSFQNLVRRVPVAENVVSFAVDLVTSTRPISDNAPDFIKEWIDWGAGPRASQYLILGAKAKAALDGRPSPDISDIRDMALPILRHRILPNFNAESEGVSPDDILLKLLDSIK